MDEELKKIEKKKQTALELAALSRIERRINLKRFQNSSFIKKELKKDKKENNNFRIISHNQVKDEKENINYFIKKSLNTGALKVGKEVIGATLGGEAIILGPPESPPFPETEFQDKEEKIFFTISVFVGFR